MGTGQNCTKTNLREGTKLHKDNFPLRVNFVRVKILHRGSFMHESKKKQKIRHYKKLKDKLIKQKKKKKVTD